jgi:hypothetical protein
MVGGEFFSAEVSYTMMVMCRPLIIETDGRLLAMPMARHHLNLLERPLFDGVMMRLHIVPISRWYAGLSAPPRITVYDSWVSVSSSEQEGDTGEPRGSPETMVNFLVARPNEKMVGI